MTATKGARIQDNVITIFAKTDGKNSESLLIVLPSVRLFNSDNMGEERESFVFHRDWYCSIRKRSDAIRLEIYDAIVDMVFDGKHNNLSEIASVVMDFVSPQIERDYTKWLDIKVKRKESGSKGGRPKKLNKSKENQKNQMVSEKPNGLQKNQTKPNESNSVSVSVTDSVSVENNLVLFEEKKDTNVSPKKKYALDLSIVSLQMREAVETWLAYKKEKGKTYKPIGFKNFYKKLCEMSNNNPQVAMEIIEQSMASNYDGIFPLKTNAQMRASYPISVDDVRQDDVMFSLDSFQAWVNRRCYKVWENLNGTDVNSGWPATEEEYQYIVSHTNGGARGLCFVVLVFNRDGWEEYYDERGFMFTYSNYIKKNGLFV